MVSTSTLNLNPDFDHSNDSGRDPALLSKYPVIDRQLKVPNYCLGSIVIESCSLIGRVFSLAIAYSV
jgi:hypothetical protein